LYKMWTLGARKKTSNNISVIFVPRTPNGELITRLKKVESGLDKERAQTCGAGRSTAEEVTSEDGPMGGPPLQQGPMHHLFSPGWRSRDVQDQEHCLLHHLPHL
jgi:hypothetical protein